MDWRHRAACRDEDPELFFPIGTTGPALLQVEEAKAVCRRCDGGRRLPDWALDSESGRRRLGRPGRGRASRPQAPRSRTAVRTAYLRTSARRTHPSRARSLDGPRSPPGAAVGSDAEAERPAQLALHEGTDDLQTEPVGARRSSNPSGSPRPSSTTSTRSSSRQHGRDDRRPSPAGAAPSYPCSTAFCTSSDSTIASGVATSAGSTPKLPHPRDRDIAAGDLGDHREHPVRDLVEAHRLVERRRTASRARRRSTTPGGPTPRARHEPPAPPSGEPAAAAAPRRSAGCSSPGGGSPGSSRPW